jgi:hypothetical protein
VLRSLPEASVHLSQILLPLVFIGAPTGALAMQLRAFLRDRGIRRRGTVVSARLLERGSAVDELEGQEYLATSKTRRTTTVRFTTREGRELTFEEDLGYAGEGLPLGEEVPLYYDPKDPARHVVGRGARLRGVFLTALLCLPFWAIGLWIALG